MAYMNFNTDSKFWKHLQVEGLDPSTNPDASGYVAYNTSTNNGIISVYDSSNDDFRWKSVVHTVNYTTENVNPSVVQNHGVVTVNFAKGGGGGNTYNIDCSTYKIVANVNNTAGGTEIAVRLPETFDFTNSFLMTTVYEINDKGVFEGESEPKVDIVDRTEGDGQEAQTVSFVRFDFQTQEAAQKRFKIMILFDKAQSDHHIVTDQIIIGNITPGQNGWNSNSSRPTVNGTEPSEYKDTNENNG